MAAEAFEEEDTVVDALDDDQERADLWSEFDREEDSAPAEDRDDALPKGRAVEDQAGAGADDGSDDDRSTAEDGGGRSQGDAGATNSESAPADSDKARDIWAEATPEQRAAFEAAQREVERREHMTRSANGRISALTRQLNELRAQQSSSQSTPGSQPGGEGNGDDQQAAGSLLETDDWKRKAEEYPEIAEMFGPVVRQFEQTLATKSGEIDQLKRQLNAVGEDRMAQAYQEQEALLVKAHPDYVQVTQGNPHLFQTWLQQQPRHIRDAAYRNADNVVDAEEAADVVDRFKSFIAEQRQQGTGSGNETPAAGTSGNQDRGAGSSGDRNGTRLLRERRRAQQESAASVQGRGPSIGSGIPADGDREAIWRAFDEMDRREAARG